MTEEERYFFDVRGYHVVENALNQDELAALNALFDAQQAALPDPRAGRARYLELIGWGKPYRDLIDHPSIAPHLQEMLGEGFRLDHEYAEHMIEGGAGGFCCIPGSHKSSFAPPASITCVGKPTPGVFQIPCPAGSAIIFTEALRHGTLAWQAPTQRRTLFYKYSPRHASWWGTFYDPSAYDYTERQQQILRSPYHARIWNDPPGKGYVVSPA